MKKSKAVANVVSKKMAVKAADIVNNRLPEEMEKIAKTEDVGNAMLMAATEFTVLVETVLRKYNSFNEEDIINFEHNIKMLLTQEEEVHKQGLKILSPRDMETVAKIAEQNFINEKNQRLEIGPAKEKRILKLKGK